MTSTSTGTSSQAWTPPAGVTAHDGTPLDADRDFFQPPPPEIGPVISAYSTLTVGKNPVPLFLRLLLVGACAVGCYALIWWVNQPGHRSDARFFVPIAAVVGFLIAVPIVLIVTGFKHTLSYVGKNGFSKHTLKGRRGKKTKDEMLLFADAAELRSGETRQYYNGVYTGTYYDYTWTNREGKRVYRAKASYRSQKGTPKTKDPYHIVSAGERAWTAHLLEGAEAELKEKGYLQFGLTKGDWVRVGPGYFEFCRGGEVARCDAAEIKTLQLAGGYFNIQHANAKWFSREGKYGFDYKKLANAKLFLVAVDRLIGWK